MRTAALQARQAQQAAAEAEAARLAAAEAAAAPAEAAEPAEGAEPASPPPAAEQNPETSAQASAGSEKIAAQAALARAAATRAAEAAALSQKAALQAASETAYAGDAARMAAAAAAARLQAQQAAAAAESLARQSGVNGELTGGDSKSAIVRRYLESLTRFDERLSRERVTESGQQAGGVPGVALGTDETGAPPPATAGGEPGGTDQPGSFGIGLGNRFPAPPGTPHGGDDDIVARQLREAAETESDPELRAKLWEEYRAYKNAER